MESATKRRKTEDYGTEQSLKGGADESPESNPDNGTNINDLPREILTEILRLYVQSVGIKELSFTVANVCQLWRDIASHSYLWNSLLKKEVKNDVVWFRQGGALISAYLLGSFYRYKKLSGQTFTLEDRLVCNSILRKSTVTEMFEQCQGVKSLTFIRSPGILLPFMFDPFLQQNGCNLIYIKLEWLYIPNAVLILNSIANSCPNLQELHVVHNKGHVPIFPLASFLVKCPQLRVLELHRIFFHDNQTVETGFPELRSFTCTSYDCSPPPSNVLEIILNKSEKLQVLNLDCSLVTADILLKIPATHLEVLNVSHTSVASSPKLTDILLKWKHSLKRIEFLYCSNAEHIEKAVMSMLSAVKEPILEALCLACTDVSLPFVIHVVGTCLKLEYLNLSTCQKIPVSMRRLYNTSNEIRYMFCRNVYTCGSRSLPHVMPVLRYD